MLEKLAFWRSDADVDLAEALDRKRGDGDAIALLPYDDGTFYLKPCVFDKDLLGGKGGYETEDGDKIILDGDGEPVKSLMGVDVVLGVDPTEHASAVTPIKAHMAQKNNIGEWLKVDRQGEIIEVGEALMPAPDSEVQFDDVGPEGTAVEAEAQRMMEMQGIREDQAMDMALEKLEKEGEVTKIFDLATPSAPVMTEDGELEIEDATHIAVDQSKGADLMPKTFSSTEIQVALDKARMEEYEEGKLVKYLVYGIVIGCIISLVAGALLIGVNSLV